MSVYNPPNVSYPVTSVFGRTGDVIAVANDYSALAESASALKSYPAQFGGNIAPILTSGNWFASDAGWSYGTSPNTLIHSANGTGDIHPYTITITKGIVYRISFTCTVTAGSFRGNVGGVDTELITASGTYTYDIYTRSTGTLKLFPYVTTARFVISAVTLVPQTSNTFTSDGLITGSRGVFTTGLIESNVPMSSTNIGQEFSVNNGWGNYPDANWKPFSWSHTVNGNKFELMYIKCIDATSYIFGGNFAMQPSGIIGASGFNTGVPIVYSYLSFNQAGNSTWIEFLNIDTSKPFRHQSNTANGASAIAYSFNQNTAFTTAGAKLFEWLNAGVQKAYIDKDGGFKGATLLTVGYTVATLPTPTVGMRAYVTDALAPAYLVAVTGGGAVTCPVFYNGSAWIVA